MGFIENVNNINANISDVKTVADNIEHIDDVAKTRPIYQEDVPDTTNLNNGALWFQPSTKKEYILSEGEWVELSAGKAGQYQGHAGPKGYGVAWLDKKGVDNDTIIIPENCAGYSVDEFVLGNNSEIVISNGATYKVL